MQKINLADSIHLKVKKKSLKIAGVVFEEISIYEKFQATVGRLDVYFGLKIEPPFAGVKRIDMEHFFIKLNLKQIKSWFRQKTMSRQNGGQKKGNPIRIPRMLLKKGSIVIADDRSGLQWMFKDVQIRYEEPGGFRISMENFSGPGIELQNIRVKVFLKKNIYQWEFAGNEKDLPLKAHGTWNSSKKTLGFAHKNIGIPKFIVKNFPPIIKYSSSLSNAARVDISWQKWPVIDWQLKAGLANLHLQHSIMHSQAVGPFPIVLKAGGRFDMDRKFLNLDRSQVVLKSKARGDIRIFFEGVGQNLGSSSKPAHWNLSLAIPQTSCQRFSSWIPVEIKRDLPLKLLGNFSLRTSLSWQWNQLENFGFRILEYQSLCQLKQGAFAGLDKKISLWKTHSRYIDYEKISIDFLDAVVAGEDSGFWLHKGFQLSNVLAALRLNLEKKKAILGGSSLTMQLIKNLFFNREKTISRKSWELFLALEIEKVFEKKKILEIYSNIVEFAPGVYGISKASEFYFNAKPDELTMAQAIHLAAILPNPKKGFLAYCKNQQPWWIQRRKTRIIETMGSFRHLKQSIIASAKDLPVSARSKQWKRSCEQFHAQKNSLIPSTAKF